MYQYCDQCSTRRFQEWRSRFRVHLSSLSVFCTQEPFTVHCPVMTSIDCPTEREYSAQRLCRNFYTILLRKLQCNQSQLLIYEPQQLQFVFLGLQIFYPDTFSVHGRMEVTHKDGKLFHTISAIFLDEIHVSHRSTCLNSP